MGVDVEHQQALGGHFWTEDGAAHPAPWTTNVAGSDFGAAPSGMQ